MQGGNKDEKTHSQEKTDENNQNISRKKVHLKNIYESMDGVLMKLSLRERLRLRILQRRIRKNEEFIFKCRDYVTTARKWIKSDVKEAKELIKKQDTPDLRIK